jgi:hypothetical protein
MFNLPTAEARAKYDAAMKPEKSVPRTVKIEERGILVEVTVYKADKDYFYAVRANGVRMKVKRSTVKEEQNATANL